MVTTAILSMLCVHLLCFCVMFLLISTRLNGRKMGMEVFALGHLLLALAYILQLLSGSANGSALSIINHTLTLCAPVAYALGSMHFFGKPTPILRPLLLLAGSYTLLQIIVQNLIGIDARHALLAASCALLFCAMAITALYVRQTVAKDLRVEMMVFATLIAGICILNAMKFLVILGGGMEALNMNSRFQSGFYIYMSFLGTVLPPCVIWLILCRLTDELSKLAAHDPLTRLLNRRGLLDALEANFRSRTATPAYLLIVDIDHFKQVNDTYGHKVGDTVLSHVAETLKTSVRQGDLICRLGGEEFVVIAQNTNRAGVLQLAERTRAMVECSQIPGLRPDQLIRCTVTIGVSDDFNNVQAFDDALQRADAALYRGKVTGRNRVEWGVPERDLTKSEPSPNDLTKYLLTSSES